MDSSWDALPSLFPDLPDADRWLSLLQRHAALLEDASSRVRVSSVPPAEAVRRQYAESLEILRIIESQEPLTSLADIGSGGGFPGFVIAAVRPDSRVSLVEPLKKRAALLQEVVEACGLQNVTVHAERAELVGRGPLRESVHVVTARAVAELRELLEYTAPLVASDGLVALPKGSSFESELAASASAIATLGCEFERFQPMRASVSPTLGVALFRKLGSTPAAYPRRPGIPGKRPL